MIYFTNLSGGDFTTDEIMEIYSRRWDIEVSYKTVKTAQEIERHISSDGDVARNDIYAKVLFHNIAGVIRKEMNQELKNRHVLDTREYVTNITQLHAIIHDTNFLYCLMSGLKERIK
ncbi:transposase [Catenibacterium mitsuokai]|uniref:transposase n=1 Tax=Catenibacterium mitsuokai TaxID=100886 RepID=UPI002E75BF86|nr:transposase [Catenibacterium tridentinum]